MNSEPIRDKQTWGNKGPIYDSNFVIVKRSRCKMVQNQYCIKLRKNYHVVVKECQKSVLLKVVLHR